MIRNTTIGFLSIMLLSGCMKEELPVPAHTLGEARTMTVCMGSAYQDQVWVDLSTGNIVSTNNKTVWDLAFESADQGWRVMLNGSRLMTAWDLGAVEITQPSDTIGMYAGRRIDAPSGHPDSTAFGDWRATGNVYLLDLGFNAFGAHLGFRKVRVNSVDHSNYIFEWAGLDGSGHGSITLQKDPTRTYTYFSFANGPMVIEPERGTWDLVFTQYTHQFYVPYLPYIVSGVLVDGSMTQVARIPNSIFEEIGPQQAEAFPFESKRDIIGYDWKYYSFDTGSYTVDQGLCFIVRSHDGLLHKLRFIDFYSSTGQPGCPTLEVVPL